MIGPTDLLHPSPAAPHFKTFQVFLIDKKLGTVPKQFIYNKRPALITQKNPRTFKCNQTRNCLCCSFLSVLCCSGQAYRPQERTELITHYLTAFLFLFSQLIFIILIVAILFLLKHFNIQLFFTLTCYPRNRKEAKHPECPATGHLGTEIATGFLCLFMQVLRWF
jgi:hypothetical protein